jgi:hypothetical protein
MRCIIVIYHGEGSDSGLQLKSRITNIIICSDALPLHEFCFKQSSLPRDFRDIGKGIVLNLA